MASGRGIRGKSDASQAKFLRYLAFGAIPVHFPAWRAGRFTCIRAHMALVDDLLCAWLYILIISLYFISHTKRHAGIFWGVSCCGAACQPVIMSSSRACARGRKCAPTATEHLFVAR